MRKIRTLLAATTIHPICINAMFVHLVPSASRNFSACSNDMAGNMQSFSVVYTIESIRFQLKWKNRFQLYSLQQSSAFICSPSVAHRRRFIYIYFINSEWRKCITNIFFSSRLLFRSRRGHTWHICSSEFDVQCE